MTEQIAPPPPVTPAPALPPMPDAPPPGTPVPTGKDRRVLRAVLRWTAAVAVFAAVGAYAVGGESVDLVILLVIGLLTL